MLLHLSQCLFLDLLRHNTVFFRQAIAVLKMLETFGTPATVRSTGGRYFGFVNGGVLPVAAASRWMSDVWDQNCALHAMCPVASKLEHVVEGWMVELLGLDAGTALGLVGGSSVATLCEAHTAFILCHVCLFTYFFTNVCVCDRWYCGST
jgi:hypothetical protein